MSIASWPSFPSLIDSSLQQNLNFAFHSRVWFGLTHMRYYCYKDEGQCVIGSHARVIYLDKHELVVLVDNSDSVSLRDCYYIERTT
jgi:hypothetical protein